MNLFSETRQFAHWFARLNKVCLTTRPFWTTFVIGATVVSNVAKLLAFLLPLKVILLAGSSGVPRYFAFFIDASDKYYWIIALTAGAVLSYVTHLTLDAVVRRMALSGGQSVTRKANRLAVVGNQKQEAQRHYARITGLTADGLFLLLALGVVTVIAPDLMLRLLLLAVGLLAVSVVWTSLGTAHAPSWIERNSKLYISIVTSTLFLAGFLMIVWPYLDGEGPNILFSLISIVLLKRSARVAARILNGSVSLTRARPTIDPLMFRGAKLKGQDQPVRAALRDLFQKPQRQAMARENLPEPYCKGELDARWEDPTLNGVHSIRIVAKPAAGEPATLFRQHIYSRRFQYLQEREQHLFQFVDREVMLAPKWVRSFEMADFRCDLVHYGRGQALTLPAWRRVILQVLERHWAVEPSRQLVKDFKLTLPLMARRLDEELIQRVQIAVEDEADQQALDQFRSQLSSIRARLADMPLYIANKDMVPANAIRANNALGVQLQCWGRWSIEPIGYRLPRRFTEDGLQQALDNVRASGRQLPASYSVADILYVHRLAQVETAIADHDYRQALDAMIQFNLSTPVQLKERA